MADRIKAVLMSNDGWSYREISKVLLLDEETISKHVEEYCFAKKLSIVVEGSESKLLPDQSRELIRHLESQTYPKVMAVSNMKRVIFLNENDLRKEEYQMHKVQELERAARIEKANEFGMSR